MAAGEWLLGLAGRPFDPAHVDHHRTAADLSAGVVDGEGVEPEAAIALPHEAIGNQVAVKLGRHWQVSHISLSGNHAFTWREHRSIPLLAGDGASAVAELQLGQIERRRP